MKNYQIDLHVHTTASDGSLTPKQVVELAIKNNMKAIAITDHNSLSGIEEARKHLENKIEIIPGIEISCCSEKSKGIEIHILGLFIDYKNKKLIDFAKTRYKRSFLRILAKKVNDIIFKIFIRNQKKVDTPVMRTLILITYKLLSAKKFIRSILRKNRKADFKEMISIRQAINLIKQAGGISVLAHPGVYGNRTQEITEEFVSCGGQGIETSYPYYRIFKITQQENRIMNLKFEKFAEANNLLISGGTDFHDLYQKDGLGSRGLTGEEFEKLKIYAK